MVVTHHAQIYRVFRLRRLKINDRAHKPKSEDLDLRECSRVPTHEDPADWEVACDLLPAHYQLKLVGHQHDESKVVVEEMPLVVPAHMKNHFEAGALRKACS